MEKIKRWSYIFWSASVILLIFFIITSVKTPDSKNVSQNWYLYRDIRRYIYLIVSVISLINGFVLDTIVNNVQEEIVALKQRIIDIEKSINTYPR